MRVLILNAQVPFVFGGAEQLAQELKNALQREGHEAEIVAIPFKWYPPERILDHILACRLLDVTEADGIPIDRVIGLKFPAYLIPHPNKVLWLIHQHRGAYDLWDHPFGDIFQSPIGSSVRQAIEQADRRFIPEARGVFSISGNVAGRLKKYNEIDASVLYPPPASAEQFYCADSGDYFFFPSRLARLKRQHLVLQALALCRKPVRVRFSSSTIPSKYDHDFRRMIGTLGLDRRVEYLGLIDEEEKRRQYANARGVIYPPVNEDYGYVTLEAMLSSKPVITCSDSGGPLEFIRDGVSGLIAAPSPESLAESLDRLWGDRRKAESMGRTGRETYEHLKISWPNVVKGLMS